MKTKLKKTLKTADKKANKKAWDIANKAHVKAYNKTRYQENTNYFKEYGKGYRADRKLQFYVVYTIPNYDGKGNSYCGITTQPDRRMANHKCDGKVNVDNYTIVDAQVEKADALTIEAEYHAQGYHGHIWRLRRAV